MRRRDLIAVVGGAVITWARAARGQQKAIPVVGYLQSGSFGSTTSSPLSIAGFRQGLSETGYVEGQNVAVEYRGAVGGQYDLLPGLAADLIGRKVDLIAAIGNA